MIHQGGVRPSSISQAGSLNGSKEMSGEMAAAGGVPGAVGFNSSYAMGLPMMPGQLPQVRHFPIQSPSLPYCICAVYNSFLEVCCMGPT